MDFLLAIGSRLYQPQAFSLWNRWNPKMSIIVTYERSQTPNWEADNWKAALLNLRDEE